MTLPSWNCERRDGGVFCKGSASAFLPRFLEKPREIGPSPSVNGMTLRHQRIGAGVSHPALSSRRLAVTRPAHDACILSARKGTRMRIEGTRFGDITVDGDSKI